MHKKYILGIDEVGRGPWAWPIVVAGFLCEKRFDTKDLVREKYDSKKISRDEREIIVRKIEENLNQYTYFTASRQSYEIDAIGIRNCNKACMEEIILQAIEYIGDWNFVEVYIDGCDNFRFDIADFSHHFAHKRWSKSKETEEQKKHSIHYIIWWDWVVPVIGIASIIAKVIRDKKMCEYSENFPLYGFASHKGYGTRKHSDALINYGITPIHRKSYAPVKRLILASPSL